MESNILNFYVNFVAWENSEMSIIIYLNVVVFSCKEKYLLVYFRLSPNVYKMAKLFITKDIVILRKLAKLGKEIVSVFGCVIC